MADHASTKNPVHEENDVMRGFDLLTPDGDATRYIQSMSAERRAAVATYFGDPMTESLNIIALCDFAVNADLSEVGEEGIRNMFWTIRRMAQGIEAGCWLNAAATKPEALQVPA